MAPMLSPHSPAVPDQQVPFLDLEPGFSDGLRDEILADIAALFRSHRYANGPEVAAFEGAFASYVGAARCVGVASGLDGLRLALLALDVGAGDEVVVPANTFVATFEAVSQAGATPVPVDVSEQDYNLAPEAVAAAVGPRTKALVPVHLYGLCADMERLAPIAARHRLAVLEDACQAHGAVRDGVRAGTAGHAAAFSFYPGKNLGAAGDAGAVVTDDASLAERLVELREHGQRRKYEHRVEGYTARLDTIQAIVLLHKLRRLDSWNEQRREAARFYGEALAGLGDLRLPREPDGSRHVWHLYVVRTQARDRLAAHLLERGVRTALHYPQPPHLSGAYRHLGHARGTFPVTERLAREVLSLPLFPGITAAQLETVVDAVHDFFRRG